MRTRLLGGLLLTVMLLAMMPEQTHAGGWASVELDAPPSEVRAGQALRISFMVKQHGVTPIHSVGDMEVKPLLTARSVKTSETLAARAEKSKAVGHFVAEVTFPSAGRWEWEIIPEPFNAGTKFPALSVLDSGAAISAASSGAPISAAAEAQAGAQAQMQARPASKSNGNEAVRLGIGIGLFVLAAVAAAVVAGFGPRFRRTRAG
jgi:hypothetical protein